MIAIPFYELSEATIIYYAATEYYFEVTVNSYYCTSATKHESKTFKITLILFWAKTAEIIIKPTYYQNGYQSFLQNFNFPS